MNFNLNSYSQSPILFFSASSSVVLIVYRLRPSQTISVLLLSSIDHHCPQRSPTRSHNPPTKLFYRSSPFPCRTSELSPGKNPIACTPSDFTLLQPVTAAQHYYASAGSLIAQTGTGVSNLLSVASANDASSSLLTTAAITALVDENGTLTSSATLTPNSLDYQGNQLLGAKFGSTFDAVRR